MGSLIGELEGRQAAVRLRVEELERELAALTVRLEVERGRLDRLTVTPETLEELAGTPADSPTGRTSSTASTEAVTSLIRCSSLIGSYTEERMTIQTPGWA
ncbi:hypothetical protein ACWD7F_27620 [Streptomyces sp. NPDC005122]